MGVFWILLLGLTVWLVARLLPSRTGPTSRSTGESAVKLLDRRMAGEMDIPAWQAQRAALQGAQDSRK